jgi:TP53 regulating kinase-like protein
MLATPHSSDLKLSPTDDWTLISQGAEARLWKIPDFRGLSRSGCGGDSNEHGGSLGVAAVAKERFSKRYRHPKLDERLTSQRCRAEARILQKCARYPHLVRVPAVLTVDAPVLYLEFLPFPTLRSYLDDVLVKEMENESGSQPQRRDVLQEVAAHLGSLLSNLHYELGIVHGDLTTSNFLIEVTAESSPVDVSAGPEYVTHNGTEGSSPPPSSRNPLVLIDFGLAKSTESAEERAVDLYVLERALLSTHPQLPGQFFNRVLAVYGSSSSGSVGLAAGISPAAASETPSTSNKSQKLKAKARAATLARLEQVRLRGRKRECFG